MADSMKSNKDDEERNTISMKTRRKQGMRGRRDDERRGWGTADFSCHVWQHGQILVRSNIVLFYIYSL